MGGHGHNGPGAVGSQDIIGNEDGYLSAVHGIDCPNALEHDPSLLLVGGQLSTLKVALPGGLSHVGVDLAQIGELVRPLLHVGVLGGNDHVGCAEQGIRPGGEHHDIVPGGGLKGDLRAGGAADPVFLLGLDPLNKVQLVQIVNEPLGVFGDLEHPLALFLTDNRRAAAFAHAVHYLLVGQNALAGGTPVHGHSGLVGQAIFEELEEDPLGPFVVFRVSGVDDPVPVEGIAQHLKLLGEVGNVIVGHLGRMDVVFDGVVFRGQAEGVVAHGKQDVISLHPLLAGHHVHGGVGAGVAYMKSLARGIGKLHQTVELRLGGVPCLGGEGLLLQPLLLPLAFNGVGIILHLLALPHWCRMKSSPL